MRQNARPARAAAAVAAAAAADRPGGEAEDGFEDDYDDDLWRLPAAEWEGGACPPLQGQPVAV